MLRVSDKSSGSKTIKTITENTETRRGTPHSVRIRECSCAEQLAGVIYFLLLGRFPERVRG
jgi:hypothetical protein